MIALWLACNTQEVDPLRRSVEHYQAGKEHWEKGDYHQAVDRFQKARTLDPASMELLHWEALALQKNGSFKESLALFEEALAKNPGNGDFRYNKAALLSQSGDYEAAARELLILYHNQDADPVLVVEDPDFQPMIQTGRYTELLPQPTIDILEVNRISRALLGGGLSLHIELLHRGVLRVEEDEFSSHLRLRSVVEEKWKGKGPKEKTVLQLEWTGTRVGKGSIDSWNLQTPNARVLLPRFEYEVLAFESEIRGGEDVDLIVPSGLIQNRPTPSFTRLEDGALLLIAPPYASMKWDYDGGVYWEVRSEGVPTKKGLYARTVKEVEATVEFNGSVLLQESVEDLGPG
ncbi:MAG: tetratricopeptide repeat protein [Myxococcota bacterium]|nr:tetratricopeptide repeat protein [Myxococcota bacterium]